MNLKTINQVVDYIDGDFIWRKKELTQYRFLLQRGENKNERNAALLRGAITLLYAHWEGFVKSVGLAYLNYIHHQNLRLNELTVNFIALSSRAIINSNSVQKNIQAHLDLVNLFVNGLEGKSVLPYKDGINTKSNLSSSVLKDIIISLGLDYSFFEPKANLIDESLLATRNTIAHGEYSVLTVPRYEEIASSIIEMMENYRTQVQNAIVLKSFKV